MAGCRGAGSSRCARARRARSTARREACKWNSGYAGSAPKRVRHALEKRRPEPVRAEQSAFDAEIGEFVDGIDHAQFRAEFQAVENGDLVLEADVFGPEIAVAVDEPPLSGARAEPIRMGSQRGVHPVEDRRRAAVVDGESPRGEDVAIEGLFLDEPIDVSRRRYRRVGRLLIEASERAGDALDVLGAAARHAVSSRSSIRACGSRRITTTHSTVSPSPSSAKDPFGASLSGATPR